MKDDLHTEWWGLARIGELLKYRALGRGRNDTQDATTVGRWDRHVFRSPALLHTTEPLSVILSIVGLNS